MRGPIDNQIVFILVYNFKAKYSILDDDIYNFNEVGFILGIIFARIVVTTFNGYNKA